MCLGLSNGLVKNDDVRGFFLLHCSITTYFCQPILKRSNELHHCAVFFPIGTRVAIGAGRDYRKAILTHEKYLSSDKLEGRFPGTKGNNRAARYIAKQFKRLHVKQWNHGYLMRFSLFIKPQTHSVSKDTVHTQNIVGYLQGKDEVLKNEYIVIGAHYDHLGWGGQGTSSKK